MVAATKCKVLIEADAHEATTLNKENAKNALQLIKELNLQKNIVAKMMLK
ncbi:hypothetical protein FACS1894218_1780 [Bacilli bacterium]|nr:hypothetical protein FACS1894218_1780 [Bacilli bacterium]